MIKVDRLDKPPILDQHEVNWLANYKAAKLLYQQNPIPANRLLKDTAENKYRHLQVKTALKLMFSDKCAFCESHIAHVDYGDIEHYKPKTTFPDHCFDWDNLLLSCGICNGIEFKGTKFPLEIDNGPFINPVDENPDDFFIFEFDPNTGTANVIPTNLRGETTEKELGLNRTELIRHRSSVVRKMVVIAIKANNGDAECLDEILKCCNKEEEYAAFARALVIRYNLV